jgi:nucleotide-binding universal stress UspA family protein
MRVVAGGSVIWMDLPDDRACSASKRGSPGGSPDPRAGGMSVHAHLRRGDPALVIAGVAAEENARLIVVGAGERGRLARRIIGASPTWSPSARPATC